MEEEEEEEHTKDGTNDKLINPAADDGARCNGGCRRRRAPSVAVVTAVTVRSGHVVSANLVQAYRSADVGSNKPTDIESRCMPHHLIDVVDPPVVVAIVVVDNVIISYDMILVTKAPILN